MSTTVATINQAKLDEKVVGALRYILPILNSFSYRASADGAIKNDSVYVPIAGDPTAQSKTAGTAVTTNGSIAGAQVQLSNHYASGWDFAEGTMSPVIFQSAWEDKAVGAVYSLAKQVVDAALGLVTALNYGDTDADKAAVAPASFDQDELATLWGKAVKKIKNQKMSIGLNADYAAALMGQSNLALVYANAGTNFVMSGNLPQMLGMPAWAYPGMPDNSENLGGAIIGQGAILVATAPVAALTSGGSGIIERRIISDESTGVSVLYTQTFKDGGLIHGECELLYGVAKGQDAVVRLVTGI